MPCTEEASDLGLQLLTNQLGVHLSGIILHETFLEDNLHYRVNIFLGSSSFAEIEILYVVRNCKAL